jgi:hypothetical protein
MDSERRKIIMVGAVLIGMVAVLYYQFSKPILPDGVTTTQPVETTDDVQTTSSEESTQLAAAPVRIDGKVLLESIEKDNFVYDYSGLRDPMTPVMHGVASQDGGLAQEAIGASRAHSLEGIVWSLDYPLASIDGTVVATGERLADGSIVKEILRDTVILSTDTGTFSVGFYEE